MKMLLGDEAVALGAINAGISAAYGYPGTPSTEIMETLIEKSTRAGRQSFRAAWCANEKTAMEAALGVSFAGRRVLVAMKHVGLNVAADPFMNSALLAIHGGLVIAVADDPGMHSSQNEQDSRYYAAFAMIPCLEPRNQQEAYDMTIEAFDLSERFRLPVMVRLVTRLAHARSQVVVGNRRRQRAVSKVKDKERWIFLPAYARKNYEMLLGKQEALREWAGAHEANNLEFTNEDGSDRLLKYVVITAGVGANYYEDNLKDFTKSLGGNPPVWYHIGAYPFSEKFVQGLCNYAKAVLVFEEGQGFIEGKLRSFLPEDVHVQGKQNVDVIESGELDPDNVRECLDLEPRKSVLSVLPKRVVLPALPARPPQLCQGCPHGDSFDVINAVVNRLDPAPNHPSVAVNSDIGCYTLGSLPPYSVSESTVCMGASIGMARGASEAGLPYTLALIGDSTFIHSGITGLVDAVYSNTPMTVAILDNSTVAMTGCQETLVPSVKLKSLILGLGVDPAHFVELEARGIRKDENIALLKKEMEYRGLSVVVFRRECVEAFRKRSKKAYER
jgi:indolepyruvate ferredoxin oxidoreductase alpha subunit